VISTLLVLAAPEAAAEGPPADGEATFHQAEQFTVRVRASIRLPFDSDEQGTFDGAGFLVDNKRGWILTNAHVVGRSPSTVQVAFKDRDYRPATKLYVDPLLDLAVLVLAQSDIPSGTTAAKMDCRNAPAVGHPVGAYGHPWGLPFTGTRGIVSGVADKRSTEMLQTDAPINQGNSGGPLISFASRAVVGINTASRKDSQNLNFAVSSKYACRILELLQVGTDPSPPDVNAIFFSVDQGLTRLRVAKSWDLKTFADLRAGDTVRSVVGSNEPVNNYTQLAHVLRGRLDDVALLVERGGSERIVRGRLPAMKRVLSKQGVYVSGALIENLELGDPDVARFYGLMVSYVESGSTAEVHDLQQYDRIITLNGQPVTDLDDLWRALGHAKSESSTVHVTLKRLTESEAGLFEYREYEIPLEEIRFVSQKELDARVSASR
jgi:S1-C subfamily serine protease